jgi:serine/threonine protein kinase
MSECAYTGDHAGWISPELIEGARPAPSSDVYAFGILLYEVGDRCSFITAGAGRKRLRPLPRHPPKSLLNQGVRFSRQSVRVSVISDHARSAERALPTADRG